MTNRDETLARLKTIEDELHEAWSSATDREALVRAVVQAYNELLAVFPDVPLDDRELGFHFVRPLQELVRARADYASPEQEIQKAFYAIGSQDRFIALLKTLGFGPGNPPDNIPERALSPNYLLQQEK